MHFTFYKNDFFAPNTIEMCWVVVRGKGEVNPSLIH